MIFTRFLQTRPRLDLALSALDKKRLRLPVLSLADYFPDFSEVPVSFYEVPAGSWSSPVADVLMLAKVVGCTKPRKLLEVGSFRGYTALTLARHMPADASLVTVDRDPKHGEAYAGTEFAARIERRVTAVETDAFTPDERESYDFIFLDAGHEYAEVKSDTEILLPLLSPTGFFLWHDYANWGRFNGYNGVPEYLHELSATRKIVKLDGTGVAAYSPLWETSEGGERLAEHLRSSIGGPGTDAWVENSLR
jgi:predicted O-methyltransferase YrrM